MIEVAFIFIYSFFNSSLLFSKEKKSDLWNSNYIGALSVPDSFWDAF